MRKTKTQKGITLVALIITIIVLLILAVVAIGAVQNDGIINRAKDARDQYGKAQDEEANTIQGYLNHIETNLKGNSGGGKVEIVPNPQEKFSTIYGQNTTITQGSYTAVIPKGFAVAVDNEGKIKSISE